MTSKERGMRIPYALGTDQYCTFEGSDNYVHMGDFVEVYAYPNWRCARPYRGSLSGVKYDRFGYISEVTVSPLGEIFDYNIAFDGFFRHAAKEANHD